MRWACLLLVLLLALPACRRFTKEGADREVYGLMGSHRADVPDVRGNLDIEAEEHLARAIRERATFQLTLRDALELATVASREYRTQRESVYLTTLTLTRELNRFRPLWDASGGVDYRVDSEGSSVGGDMSTTLSRAFERGGGIVIGLANLFLTDITGDPLRVAESILSADVTLPLLRGAGTLVTLEPLRQAENNVLYALRDYALFQQQFTVDISSRFYRALQARDAWDNAEARYESLGRLVDEQREKASAGRIPKFEVDQILQDLLTSDDGRTRRQNDFERLVDQLKLDLGIPVGVTVTLQDTDFQRLRATGPQPMGFGHDEAATWATERRLDLRTAFDREADAARHAVVARDALRAGLDLRAGGDLRTPRDRPLDFDSAEAFGNLGLDFDLPLERTDERNVYRRALIAAERARRDREATQDVVVFEVRDAWRSLAETRRSFDIQVESAKLAERRVESTQLLLELGQARTRDRLDAETSLLQARNAVTAALVDHQLARLGLERDVGILHVDARGQWTPAAANAVSGARGSAEIAAPATFGVSADPLSAANPAPAVVPRSAPPPAPLPTPAARPAASNAGDLPAPVVRPRRSGTVEGS
ncbi:MAG: TolC family protein [Planctomycetota bacterium]|nr:TolC family protein [Planctomycetota bacterium]